jgi:hypothetical protein
MWWVTTQKNGASALGPQRVLGLKRYETAWTLLHRLRRAMVRPGRDLLTGRVEVDECYMGGLEEGLHGRLNLDKALIVIAAQEDGPGMGRIRMRQIVDASAASLVPFVQVSDKEIAKATSCWLSFAAPIAWICEPLCADTSKPSRWNSQNAMYAAGKELAAENNSIRRAAPIALLARSIVAAELLRKISMALSA